MPNKHRDLVTILGSGGAADTTPPAKPTGLTAAPASVTQINLAWTDVATDETAYKVYRSTNGVSYAQVGTDLAAGTQVYSDTTPTAGTKYYYKAAAVNTGGETLSDAVTANTLTLTINNYWKLDESSAGSAPVTRNDSVGGMALTDNGTVASTTGILSNGGAFVVADNTYLSHADNAVLQMGDIDFTIAFWFNPSDLGAGTYPGLVVKDNTGGTRDYSVILNWPTASKLGFQVVTGAGAQTLANTTVLNLGSWYFVVAWHDASADMMYLQVNNGTAASKATGGALAAPSTNVFMIGRLSNYFAGTIDEVGIWKRVLTSGERTALHNGGAGLTYPF
jgi:hypothetical protein